MDQNYTKVTWEEVMQNFRQETAALSVLADLNLGSEELDALQVVYGRLSSSLETLFHIRDNGAEKMPIADTPPVFIFPREVQNV